MNQIELSFRGKLLYQTNHEPEPGFLLLKAEILFGYSIFFPNFYFSKKSIGQLTFQNIALQKSHFGMPDCHRVVLSL